MKIEAEHVILVVVVGIVSLAITSVLVGHVEKMQGLNNEVEIQKARLVTLEKLASSGVDPIASRCAILGDQMSCLMQPK